MYRHLKSLWQHFKKHLVKQLARFGLKQEHTMQAKGVNIKFINMCKFSYFFYIIKKLYDRGGHERKRKAL